MPKPVLAFSDTSAPSLPPRSRTATTTSHLTARPLPQPLQPSTHQSTASSVPSMPACRCMTRLRRGGPVFRSSRSLCTNFPAVGLRTRCCCPKARPCQAPSTPILATSTSSTHLRESPRLRLISGTRPSATTSHPRLAATAPIRCPARPGGRRPRPPM